LESFLIKQKNYIMKKNLLKLLLVFFVALAFSFTASAQFVVRTRPAHTVVVARPERPSPRHVWVEGEWAWRNGHYEYVDGYWAVPGDGYSAWVPGHWRKRRGGWVWIAGHWR
jgi:hypothetical protein